MSLSSDPQARERQLSNLQRGSESAGTIRPGERRALKHGLFSRPGSLAIMESDVYRELVELIVEALPVRGNDGRPHPADVLQAEAVAHQGTLLFHARAWRVKTPEDTLPAIQTESVIAERYSRGLERLGIGPSARARLGLDVLRAADLATAMSEPDPERRAVMLREAGLDPDAAEAGGDGHG